MGGKRLELTRWFHLLMGDQCGRIQSFSLCHSAIWRRGEFKTSFQWCKAVPIVLAPPNSKRPITCFKSKGSRLRSKYYSDPTLIRQSSKITSFLVTRSQSRTRNSRLILSSEVALAGKSKTNDSLKTGFSVRFLTCVFFLATRCPLCTR